VQLGLWWLRLFPIADHRDSEQRRLFVDPNPTDELITFRSLGSINTLLGAWTVGGSLGSDFPDSRPSFPLKGRPYCCNVWPLPTMAP
jgi:hypothetical protein